jgi:hypothetical protein
MRLTVPIPRRALAVTAMLLLAGGAVWAQGTAGSITGSVVDAQGAVVPGATVTATNVARGTTTTTTTSAIGRFDFLSLQPATYKLSVEISGFKKNERTVNLGPNDKLAVGNIRLEVGEMTETIEVTAGRVLQSASAERGDTLVAQQMENIAVNGRSYLALTTLVPGVINTNSYQTSGHAGLGGISANGGRTNQNNLTLDGIGNVDTGNNGDQLATLSLESVSEFKMLTANYQAEYGRSSGAQISVVTKGGTQSFHGSGYGYYRDDSLNANTWWNNRDGVKRQVFNVKNGGYTIGGPVYIPGKFNTDKKKLFFFLSQEFQRQLRPENLRQTHVPTALERMGDFSQSIDRDGNLYPYVRDWTTGLPCSKTDTRGCFQDGGVVGRIPQSRLYAPGLAILNMYPAPNASAKTYNYESQESATYPRREDMIRLDWEPSDTLRIYARYINNYDKIVNQYGPGWGVYSNIPFEPIHDIRPGKALAVNVTKMINPSTVNELIVGFGRNEIDLGPEGDGLTRAKWGLSGLPSLYPDAIAADSMPRFDFGGRIGGGAQVGSERSPFWNYNRTVDIIDNFSKTFNRHVLKAGFYFQRSFKDQTSDANYNGVLNFNETGSNPYDTTFGYANAAIGVYNSYAQASINATGQYRYNNYEWYLQDNWKATQRLTLDFGIRFYVIEPQYDAQERTSTFLPERFDPTQAVRLFWPAFDASGKKIGIDNVTGRTVPETDIGKIVPGSGNTLNGIVKAGDGIERGLQKGSGVLFGPRFGFAYDITGEQKLILRGGVGVFYDRYQGNETFSMMTNPPTTIQPTLYFGLLKDVDPKNALLAPSGLQAFAYNGDVPTSYNFNLGVQARLPWDFTLDVSYVGNQMRHQVQRINLNAIPYGATFKWENQDPTKKVTTTIVDGQAVPDGNSALDRNFLRPYPGYADIALHTNGGSSNYNALQVGLNRRFRKGLFLGTAYTWSRALGVTSADGDYIRIDDNVSKLYGPLGHHRLHNLVANFIYELPKASKVLGDNFLVKTLLDDWQISGVYMWQTGQPYGIGFSIAGVGNQNLTGSYTEGARVVILNDPGPGNSSDPYRQFDTSAFAAAKPGSLGLESGVNYMTRPGINNLDLSLQKTFPISKVRVQLRLDAFNALNHTQWSGVNSTINIRSLADPTPTNLPYDANGNLVNLKGFGTVSGSRAPRIVQLMARIQF